MKTKYSNKKLGIALACLGLGFTLTQSSCTKDFEKYNTNKYNATDSLLKIDGEGLGSFIIPMQLGVFNSTNYNYQVQQNLNADIWSGFMMSGDPFKGGNNNTNYGLASSSDWNHAAFDLAYPSIMSNWLQVKIRAEKTTPDYYAIATILKVEGMHRLTDIYGPIPYSQFGKNALTTPYDSQQSVYTQMFADLDGAIKALTAYVKANPNATPFKPYDLIYNGDYKEWLKFANSLRLRLAIRISLVDPATAQTQGNAALTDPNGLMTTNADNAFVKASNGVTFTNPLWSICYEYTDINMGAPMECYLKGFKDPRIDAWFVKNSAGDYRGIRQGVAIQSTADYADASRFNMTNTSPIKFMTSSEVAFLCAEAALKGWSVAGSAQTWYEKGIQLSFEQAGVSIGNYLSDATSTEAPYTDLVKASNNVTAGSPNLSTITIKWNDGDSNDRKLERILTQKWLALWPDGQEAWSEYRRTGYPVLMPVVINNSGGTVNSQIEVRRLPFPINEFTNNKAEVTKALSLLNGPDTGGTPLWWDVNPAHKFQ